MQRVASRSCWVASYPLLFLLPPVQVDATRGQLVRAGCPYSTVGERSSFNLRELACAGLGAPGLSSGDLISTGPRLRLRILSSFPILGPTTITGHCVGLRYFETTREVSAFVTLPTSSGSVLK